MSPLQRILLWAIPTWVAVWPLAHRVLVSEMDINPWKLGGFAMYTVPVPPVQVVVFGVRGRGLVPIDETTLEAPARRALDRFRIDRHALGKLAVPDAVGAQLLEALPDEPSLVIAVQRMKLDPETARMTSVRDQYIYRRSGPSL